MNRFERRANARSSTTLPSKPLNRFAMTEMTTTTGRCSGKTDSCDSLAPAILLEKAVATQRRICALLGLLVEPHHPVWRAARLIVDESFRHEANSPPECDTDQVGLVRVDGDPLPISAFV
jgi:hypothetical protein